MNRKKMPFDDMLFLSIREKDNYKIIRLEGKRKNILRANEKILKTDCKNFEEAYLLCRSIRDFINPELKINNIKIGSGSSANIAGGMSSSRSEDIEIWEFMD